MANPWDSDPVVGGKTSSPAEFAQVYGQAAKVAGAALKVDPSVILGQWGLETGWGKSIVPGTNNLGNIKDFSGGGTAATDNANGSKDNYRSYATPDDFAKDYVGLIQRKYPGAMNAGDDSAKFTSGLKGYAEDPRYADKVAVAARIAGNASNPILRGLQSVTDAIFPSANAAPKKGNPWDNDPIVTAPKAAPAKGNPWDNDPVVSSAKAPVSMADQIPGQSAQVQANAAAMAPAQKPQAPTAGNQQNTSKDNLLGKILGPADAALSAGSGMLGGIVGPVVGVAKNIVSGKYGTREGMQEADKTAADVADKFARQPVTNTGNKLLQTFNDAMNNSGAVALMPMAGELSALGRGVAAGRDVTNKLAGASADAMAEQDSAALAPSNRLAGLIKADKSDMAGVGAASTADEALRAQRFADMGIKPTQGQLSRTFEDTKFEREAAKTPEGAALNERYAQQNQQVGQHLDNFADQTGAQSSGLRATGKSVFDAVGAKKSATKSQVDTAYNAAREAGQMAQPVDVAPILKFVDDNQPAALNAPIINSVEAAIKKLDPEGTGKIPINDMEQIRQMVGTLSQKDAPSAHYGKLAIGLIDDATEGKGGPMYQQARRMNENYMNQFENRDVIDKLLRNKSGTKDRAVANEDVMQHTLLDGSLDDVKHVFRTLEAYPVGTDPAIVEAGQQAARELRGSLMNHIKEKMFSNAGADILGNTVGSEAKIKSLVTELDKSGKLEAIYGKQGAQQIRDARDAATDIYTSPSGTINSSNNRNDIVKAVNKLSSLAGLPYVGKVAEYAAKRAEKKALSKRVQSALNPKTNRLQDATRTP